MTMTAKVTLDFRDTIRELGGFSEGLRRSARAGLFAGLLGIEGKVKSERFIQPAVDGDAGEHELNVRTGQGRRSILSGIEDVSGGFRGFIGSPLIYIRAHEFGFEDTVEVDQHTRTSALGNSFIVRAHQRAMNLRARHMIQHTVGEQSDAVKDVVDKSLRTYAETLQVPKPGELL